MLSAWTRWAARNRWPRPLSVILERPFGPGAPAAAVGVARGRGLTVAALFLAAMACPRPAGASEATDRLNEAIRADLEGGTSVTKAFALYLQAAEAGLPEAEFDVAVMYDSGRGVGRDVAQAATWYARAATRGNRRAAYNLGQLYEAGQGVPLNPDLARAWFSACDLAAARDHLAGLPAHASDATSFSPPTAVAPGAAAKVRGMGGVELVWTSKPQPEAVRFFVELRALEPSGSHEVYSGSSETSALFVALPDMRGDYAWRVLAVGREASRYAASGWQRFTVAAE